LPFRCKKGGNCCRICSNRSPSSFSPDTGAACSGSCSFIRTKRCTEERSRAGRLPAGTLNRELARLADAGLLKRERRGNQLLYSAERACPVETEARLAGRFRARRARQTEDIRDRHRT
jgi:DNA-binding transcriptional ArsR family regulator